MKRVALLCFLVLGVAYGQTIFTADIEISNKPGVSGILTGAMWYDSTQKLMKITYNLQGTGKPIEIIDYNADQQVRYLGCGNPLKCNAESYKSPMPGFFQRTSDSSATATCGSVAYSRNLATDSVAYISFLSGKVCSATLTDGTVFTFSNVQTQTSIAASVFAVSTWGCPAKECNIQIDMAVVLDTSGSVGSEWKNEKAFAVNLVSAFTISETAVKVGLVGFSTGSRLELRLNNNKQSVINAINACTYDGDSTCIGCGLYTAKQSVLNAQGARPGVQEIIVLVTDGQNNVGSGQTALDTAAANAKVGGTWVFTVGVTTAINEAELKRVASGTNGFMTVNGKSIQTYFLATKWSDLTTILKSLIDATCQDLPGNACGTGCKGFCACDKQCLCPDKCDDRDKCKVSQCSTTANGAGCTYTTKNCADSDACTTDTCDSSTGCVNTKFTTCPYKACNTGSCVSPVGCVYKAVDCEDGLSCTDNYCDAAEDKCKARIVPCDLCNERGLNSTTCQVGKPKCEIWDCVQPNITYAGCVKKADVDCDDQNACTADSCNPGTGQCVHTAITCDDKMACTDDTCNPASGCVYTLFNATARCNDFSACTNDICDNRTGCANVRIPCTGGNPCTTSDCNSLTGCFYPSINCGELPQYKNKIGDCFVAQCNDGTLEYNATTQNPPPLGCFLEQQPGTTVDDCEVCNGNGQSCFLGIGVAAAAGIGAGIVAAIVIGVVAAVAIVGAVAGKKGYDAYMKHKRDMLGANNNALYRDPGTSGTNPFFTEMK